MTIEEKSDVLTISQPTNRAPETGIFIEVYLYT